MMRDEDRRDRRTMAAESSSSSVAVGMRCAAGGRVKSKRGQQQADVIRDVMWPGRRP